MAPQRALLRAGEAIDRAFLRLVLGGPVVRHQAFRELPIRSQAPEVVARIDEAIAFFRTKGDVLFPAPVPIRPLVREVGLLPDGEVLDLSWRSGWIPLHPDYARLLSAAPPAGRTAVRWLRHRHPAPAVICIHGWGAGQVRLESRAWRARRLYARGLDVLLFTLPFHAARMAPGRPTPPFPHPDPFRSNEPLAQAVFELRCLAAYLRRRDAPAVGIAGMSLGGYTASLAATVEAGWDFVLPIIPVASVGELMWTLGARTLARSTVMQLGLTAERFAEAFAPTCPLQRAPLISGDRILVLPGLADRVVPANHAHRLAAHFQAPIRPFPGCHLLQLGRDELFRSVVDHLVERGHLDG